MGKIGVGLVVSAVLLISGCVNSSDYDTSGEQQLEPPSTESSRQSIESDDSHFADDGGQGIEVDEGLLSVEITLPADLLMGMTDEEIAQNAEQEGYTDFTINPDGSVTYVIPKDIYEEGLEEMRRGIDETIQESIDASPLVFESITHDEDMTQFDVRVHRAAYEEDLAAGFIGFSLAVSGAFFQVFSGIPEERQRVVIDFFDVETGDVFETQTWPDDYE